MESAFRLLPRAVPLDANDPAVVDAWSTDPTDRTLAEYCATEWTDRPEGPVPPTVDAMARMRAFNNTMRRVKQAKRRAQVRRLLGRQFTQAEIAASLGVAERTIEYDVAAIKSEMARELASETAVDVANDFRRQAAETDRVLWMMLDTTDKDAPPIDHHAKLGVLKELGNSRRHTVRALQSLGVVYKLPAEVVLTTQAIAQVGALSADQLAQLNASASPQAFVDALSGILGPDLANALLAPGPSPVAALPPGARDGEIVIAEEDVEFEDEPTPA